jgi:hypothetical protein
MPGQWTMDRRKVGKVPLAVRKIQFIMKTVMGRNENFLYV